MSTAICYHSADLPWSIRPEDARRFQRTLALVSGLLVLLAVVVPFLPVSRQATETILAVPPRYAKLMLQQHKPPPPPAKKPAPKKPEVEQKIKPKGVKPKKHPTQKLARQRPSARERASHAGLLAFSDALMDLRNNDATASIRRQQRRTRAPGRAVQTERSIITTRAVRGSGGIQTAQLSRNTGKTQLAVYRTRQVQSALDHGQARQAVRHRNGGLAPRSDEEIQLVFDRNKGKLYSLYNRALRRDSSLAGKVVLKLTIAPSGKVTVCQIISSELNSPALERRLLARIRLFNFGLKTVVATTVRYPIDFFPG